MKKINCIILFCFFARLCSAQDSSTHIISGDTSQPVYVLAPHDSIIHIPDSAGTNSLHGYAYILLLVDYDGNINQVSIVKTQLYDGNKVILKYSLNEKYVSGNLPYYSNFFDRYCKNMLKLEKIGIPKRLNNVT
ncbi:MAG TPA: hypothetical protein VK809_08335, partial [Bacteroidia bacterium]|nr:hypothetical protein [Bacteroidia bacterium]